MAAGVQGTGMCAICPCVLALCCLRCLAHRRTVCLVGRWGESLTCLWEVREGQSGMLSLFLCHVGQVAISGAVIMV